MICRKVAYPLDSSNRKVACPLYLYFQIAVNLSEALSESITVNTSIGSTTIGAGSTQGFVTYNWDGDDAKRKRYTQRV